MWDNQKNNQHLEEANEDRVYATIRKRPPLFDHIMRSKDVKNDV